MAIQRDSKIDEIRKLEEERELTAVKKGISIDIRISQQMQTLLDRIQKLESEKKTGQR